MALTSDYTGIFQDEWLRKQKRSELRDFLRSDVAYAIVEGPPGSLKTACVQHVAAELKYSVKECDVEGVYDDERVRLLGQRLSTNSDLVDLDRGGDGSHVVTLVFNVDLAKNASAWLSLGPARKGTKVIFEVHDIPKELATFVSKGVVRKITFKPLQQRDMQRVASAIGFRNPPPDVLKCGDANMLYTASVTQCSDAWKDLQLKPYSEAEEIVHGRRTEVREELTPFFLQQQCGQFMSLESYAAFQEDVTLADKMASDANAAEGDWRYALGTCSFLAASARKNADSIPGRIDWSGGLNALGRKPGKRPLTCALQNFSLEDFDMLATKKRRTSERTEYAARGHTTAPAASEAGSDCLARYFGEATLGAAEAAPNVAVSCNEMRVPGVVSVPVSSTGAGTPVVCPAVISATASSDAALHLREHGFLEPSRSGGSYASPPAAAAGGHDHVEPSGQVVYDGKPEFEIRKVDVTQHSGEFHGFAPGPRCGNYAKSRVVIFAKCSGLQDFESIARTVGVLGCIVAEFTEGTFALVFKERNREFKACQECYALCDARVSHTVVHAACCFFLRASHKRNVEIHRKHNDQEMPDFEEVCELLKETSCGDFSALHANALKARKYKRCTPIQEAILTYTGDLKEYMKAKEDAESMIFKTTSPGPHFIRDFKRTTVLGLEGVHFENDGRIRVTTLRDVISEPQSATKPPLYLAKTLIFVGVAGSGKSEFMHALAREFCKRKNKFCYGCSASIDPYGLMTKSGKMKDLGCSCLYDLTLTSRLDHLLDREEVKGLLYVKERAHVPARYHQAIFYEWVPRMWSVNYGVDDRGNVDRTEWFTSQGYPALAALFKRDAAAILRGGEPDKAIARRSVIFSVDENLFEEAAQGATDAVGLEIWRAEQANATPLD